MYVILLGLARCTWCTIRCQVRAVCMYVGEVNLKKLPAHALPAMCAGKACTGSVVATIAYMV